MKYGRIDAVAHKFDIVESDLFNTAARLCGLEDGKVDHGTLQRCPGVGGIGIVVAEFGLFVPPLNQHYFAVNGRLYAGSAMVYAFDEFGCTIDFDDPSLVAVRWFAGGYDVANAITRGELIRPQMTLNGSVVWEWPQPRPDLGRLAREIF